MDENTKDEKPRKVIPLRKDRRVSEAHLRELRASGLSDETIAAARIYSEEKKRAISELIGRRFGGAVPALVFPVFDPRESEPVYYRVKPRRPWKGSKYTQASKAFLGFGFGIYFPPRTVAEDRLADVSTPLILTEGEKKSLLLDQLGYATIGAQGVSNFHDTDHREETDNYRLHEWIRRHVALKGRECRIAFDAQAYNTDHPVYRAAGRLKGMLLAAGASKVILCPAPPLEEEGEAADKAGVDDLFHHRGEEATRAVIDSVDVPLEALPVDDPHTPIRKVKALNGGDFPAALRWPAEYSADRRRGIWQVPEGEGAAKLVTHGLVVPRRILIDEESGEERFEVAFWRQGRWQSVAIDRAPLGDRSRIIRELRPHGIMVDSGNALELVRFFTAFEALNERKFERVRTVPRCGWVDYEDGDQTPRTTFLAPEPLDDAPLAFERRTSLGPVVAGLKPLKGGSLKEHRGALQEAFDSSDLAAAVILGALATPLLRPLGADSFGIHLVGDSSKGKSSMLKIAASVYGDPRSKSWLPSWNSTSVGHEVRAATLTDLPFCVDEVGAAAAKAAERDADIYRLIDGTGRQRGTRDGGLRELRQWRTIVLSTGEKLLAAEDTNAGAKARIMQMRVTGFGDFGAAEVDRVREACLVHAGHVGQAWLAALVGLSEERWSYWREQHRRLTEQSRLRAAEADPSGMASRRASFIATLAVAEVAAYELIGLGSKRPSVAPQLFGWLLSEGRIQTAGERALDIVRDWVASRHDAFPKMILDASGGRRPESGPTRERFGFRDEDAILFLPGPLEEYLKRHNLDASVVKSWLEADWLKTNPGRSRYRKRIQGEGNMRFVALKRDIFDPNEGGWT